MCIVLQLLSMYLLYNCNSFAFKHQSSPFSCHHQPFLVSCLFTLQGLLWRTVSYHLLLQCTGKHGFWLICGILAAGKIKNKLKKKKKRRILLNICWYFFLPVFLTYIIAFSRGSKKPWSWRQLSYDSIPIHKYYSWTHIFWSIKANSYFEQDSCISITCIGSSDSIQTKKITLMPLYPYPGEFCIHGTSLLHFIA